MIEKETRDDTPARGYKQVNRLCCIANDKAMIYGVCVDKRYHQRLTRFDPNYVGCVPHVAHLHHNLGEVDRAKPYISVFSPRSGMPCDTSRHEA